MMASTFTCIITPEEAARAKRIYNHIHPDDPIINEDDPRNTEFTIFQMRVGFLGGIGRRKKSEPASLALELLEDPKYKDIK